MPDGVGRSFPPYFLEHREEVCRSAVVKIPDRPIWCLQSPGGWSVNSIVIEGDDGIIVCDTGVCHEQGLAIKAEIDKLTSKPIRAIVYSHHHVDHCHGTDALATPEQVASGEVEILASETFSKEYADENHVVGPIMGLRASYMYGALLPPEEQSYTGLGARFVGGRLGRFLDPTRLVSGDTDVEIAGVRLHLFLTGGEASSEMGIHLPDHRTAIVADEVYAALPNLYTLRGSKFRDAGRWAAASDRILGLDVDALLGCHMAPILGADRIRRVLTTYRDALQYNHDQAVRHILAGATAEELRSKVKALPDYLDLEPYTREMYGKVAGNAAQQFTGYLGWFDGDATNLAPTPRGKRARRLVKMMGGRRRVLDLAEESLSRRDPQWTAELATLILSINPADARARALKAAALRALGYREQNATWRNWYLTGALELEGSADPGMLAAFSRAAFLSPAIGAGALLEALRFTVDPPRVGDRHLRIGVVLSDTEDVWTLEMRNSVLILHEGRHENATGEVLLSLDVLSEFISGGASFASLVDSGEVQVLGVRDDVTTLFGAFETAPPIRGFHAR